jgi:hypothetical protein
MSTILIIIVFHYIRRRRRLLRLQPLWHLWSRRESGSAIVIPIVPWLLGARHAEGWLRGLAVTMCRAAPKSKGQHGYHTEHSPRSCRTTLSVCRDRRDRDPNDTEALTAV